MQITSTAEEQEFRQTVRAWLEENVPAGGRPRAGQGVRDFDVAWQHRQYKGGWAGIAWPKEYGGKGLTLAQQLIWYEEGAKAGAPVGGSMFIALSHAGPTLIMRGTEQQKSFHLPKILSGEAVWCQGFSEPDAGSDLAGVRTRGVIDGEHMVVNGSKIWTSYAYLADYQELIVRTDPDSSRHKGLTWIICDMHLPGITIQRIPTMSGTGNLCQVFYDDVRIPLSNVVGQINDGWNVALTTLGFERGTAFINHQVELAETVEKLVHIARASRMIEDDYVASRLAQLKAEVAALRAITFLSVSRAAREDVPGPEGNIVALYYAELSKRVYEIAVELSGPEALELRPTGKDWTVDYLDAFKNTIAGGTSEIRRNVIGERMLGLPRK
jgi:alkylation response protein AidB-like acyl-CoA dehydrogenase